MYSGIILDFSMNYEMVLRECDWLSETAINFFSHNAWALIQYKDDILPV